MKKLKKNLKIDYLCEDLLIEIFMFLKGTELFKIKRTCKIFNYVINNEIIWKKKSKILPEEKRELSPKSIAILEDNNFIPNSKLSNEISNEIEEISLGPTVLLHLNRVLKNLIVSGFNIGLFAVNNSKNKIRSVKKNCSEDYEKILFIKLGIGEPNFIYYSNWLENISIINYTKKDSYYYIPEFYKKRWILELYLKRKGYKSSFCTDKEQEIIYFLLKINI